VGRQGCTVRELWEACSRADSAGGGDLGATLLVDSPQPAVALCLCNSGGQHRDRTGCRCGGAAWSVCTLLQRCTPALCLATGSRGRGLSRLPALQNTSLIDRTPLLRAGINTSCAAAEANKIRSDCRNRGSAACNGDVTKYENAEYCTRPHTDCCHGVAACSPPAGACFQCQRLAWSAQSYCRISSLDPRACANPWFLVAHHKAVVAMPRASMSVCEDCGPALVGPMCWESERRCGLCRPQGPGDVLLQRQRLQCVCWSNKGHWSEYKSRLSRNEVSQAVLMSALEVPKAPSGCRLRTGKQLQDCPNGGATGRLRTQLGASV